MMIFSDKQLEKISKYKYTLHAAPPCAVAPCYLGGPPHPLGTTAIGFRDFSKNTQQSCLDFLPKTACVYH